MSMYSLLLGEGFQNRVLVIQGGEGLLGHHVYFEGGYVFGCDGS